MSEGYILNTNLIIIYFVIIKVIYRNDDEKNVCVYVYDCILFTDTNADAPTLPENEKQDNAEPLIEDKTASDILDLLTEIKDCKDICIIEPNFHPCPWCSGRLITV